VDTVSRCRGCGAEILWTVTTTNKRMPLDAQPENRATLVERDADGTMVVKIVPTYLPHWASCPQADDFRRKQPTTKGSNR
jgi:hypothetical protein